MSPRSLLEMQVVKPESCHGLEVVVVVSTKGSLTVFHTVYPDNVKMEA